jgi:N-acetylglucosaminyl-diphospho-decaprenol L-rhamnosyltransferase
VSGSVFLRIVVVTYSPGAHLQRLLDSLPSSVSVPYEVVLADNGSTDGIPERAAAARTEVEFRPTGGNLGYGRGANAGAEGAATDWILVCNPDIEMRPGALDALLSAADRWPRAGSLGPAIRETDGTLYPSARALPSLRHGVGHAVLGRLWASNPWTRSYRRENDYGIERESGWLSGACLLVRRAAWDSVGGFDPAYFMYFEDVDLGDRLGRAGWQNVYVPSAEVVHAGGTTTARTPIPMLQAHHQSADRYVAARYPAAVTMLVRLGLRARLEVLKRRF